VNGSNDPTNIPVRFIVVVLFAKVMFFSLILAKLSDFS
jgi:hypothetical protein